MSGFIRVQGSRLIAATFTGFEADMLRSLAAQLVELLRDQTGQEAEIRDPLERLFDFAGPTHEPEDPVLRRLLPSAYPDDEVSAAEFRRFTEGALRDGKVAAAAAIIQSLTDGGLGAHEIDPVIAVDVELDEATAELWLRSLTDVRLALATRLGVEEADEGAWHELSDEDPRLQTYNIYLWLGYLQETLVDQLGSFTW
jgi:hypothetical protein